jgi:hypothetical protein
MKKPFQEIDEFFVQNKRKIMQFITPKTLYVYKFIIEISPHIVKIK